MSDDLQDVIIIGGGPAGATAASFLSMFGHKVTLLEKEKFPRDHVGESLLPFCYKLFGELGLLDQMKASFVRKPGVRFVDSDGKQSTTWCFNRVIPNESFLSFQVARSDFDKLQLDNARRKGATVCEESRVDSVQLDGPDGMVEVQVVNAQGDRYNLRARFLLDCSGRSTFLASRKGLKKKFDELDRTALWTHYSGAPLMGGLEEGLSLIIYLGGDKKGWLWVFPLGPNRLTVGVVLNNSYLRMEKAKFEQQGVKDWQMALYQQELNYSSFVQRLLASAHIIQPLVIEGDYSYFTETKYGPNYAMVGDAAQFIDPIFSSGIFLAMNSARLVTHAVHQKLTGEDSSETALKAAYTKIEGAYKMVFKLIRFFYSANTINFAQMSTASDEIHKEHENAMAVGHFLLAGDFFDRYEEYGKIIDLLYNPSLFRHYQKLVIKRPSFQDASCNMSLDDAFHQLLNKP
jgi:flavin-dependent dehydrogenase